MWPLKQKTYKAISIVIMALCSWVTGIGQTIIRPIPGNACFVAGADSRFNITTTTTGGSFPNGTDFVLRLSDKSGDFNSNTIIVAETKSSGINIEFLNFSYPSIDGEGTTLGSDNYRLRVEEKNGAEQSSRSNNFSAYFYDGTSYVLEPRVLCSFNELRAEPNNLPEYEWHRITDTGIDQIIAGEVSSTLMANMEGRYYYTIPLGNCFNFLPEARSNLVRVFEARATAVPNFTVSMTAGSSPFCAGESSVTLSSSVTNPSFFYQWIRDDEALIGENGTSITLTDINSEGEYFLEISDDSDRSIERCALQSQNKIFVDLNNPFVKFPPSQSLTVIDIPGADEILNVEVTGEDPKTIVWLKDGVEITGSNSTSLLSSGPGAYTAKVTGSSCPTFNEDTTDTTVNVIAIDNLNITIDYVNSNYTDCSLDRIGLRIERITTTVSGSAMDIPLNSFSSSDITWFNNGAEVSGLLGSNILIDDAGGNGNYQARINLGSGFLSNNLSVKLNPGELSIEASQTSLSDDITTSELSVPLPAEAILSLYRYRWLRILSISEENVISTSSTVEVTEPGNYTVEVTFDDCPPSRLNTIAISSTSTEVPNILTPNGFNNTRWRLPEKYTLKSNVAVQIISSSGEEVLNQTNYGGNWPDNELKESIYYYIISLDNNPVEKGTITIIR